MALAFLASGWALRRTPGLNAIGLLANAAITMGALSIVGLICVWDPALISGDFPSRLPALFGIVAFYFLGQCAMFTAQLKIDSSRVVPLLGLKLPILALITALLERHGFSLMQVLAILLTVVSAFLLNNAGRRIPLISIFFVLIACLFYSLSDTCIKLAMNQLEAVIANQVKASAQCTFLTYILLGIVGSVVLLSSKKFRPPMAFARSSVYGVIWLISIVFLTICFTRLGTVNGNILQSTRGIFAILIAPVLAGLGFTDLEERVRWVVHLRRAIAALMMIAAVLLYNIK